jgi:hypothetical protein
MPIFLDNPCWSRAGALIRRATVQWLILAILAVCIVPACKKDTYIRSVDAQIEFSTDTVKFDTVFTSVGSITQSFKILNPNNQKLLLSDVRLMGGSQSAFQINVDGAAGTDHQNITIEADDSLYVFVSVYVNPSNASLAFILSDSIRVSFNGNQFYIQLQAFGQNAHFLTNAVISSNTSWPNDLPYVILGGLDVDSNATLTLEPGTKVYFHANAPLLVDGTLLVQGQKYDSTRVYFLGDRLDYPYSSFPGSWPGIYFRSTSKDNVLEFAVIRNAYEGIVSEDPSIDANPRVTLDECILDNIYDAGILGSQTSIQARNCLVSNCGRNIALAYGGSYSFVHCTVASYSNYYITHQNPVLYLSNYTVESGNTVESDLNAQFTNCIFWGDFGTVTDEVQVAEQGNTIFSVIFTHCLWKVMDSPNPVDTTQMLVNMDPLFDSVNNQLMYYDFHLKPGSPAINQGINTGIPFDLDGNPRAVGLPDLGCYELQ